MENHKVLIIAEAGVNHNGEIALAKKLVDIAVSAGADVVKFQTFKAENLVTPDAEMANYQITNTKKNESQFDMLKRLELSEDEFLELQEYCKEKKIIFFSTGFDLESLKFLKKMKMGMWKIPSGEITNLPYLEFLGQQNEPVIISTGMSYMEEIAEAINVLRSAGLPLNKITVLHCNTDYPSAYSDVHLRAMKTIGDTFKVNIGYSDHTPGIEVSIAAVALGATVIEKHFTIDQNMEGPDHKASLTPSELSQLVKSIRNIEKALGRSEKIPSEGEIKNRTVARKSIVAATNIKKEDIFSSENLTIKRPGNGLSPMKLRSILGQKSPRDYKKDELIEC